MSDDWYAVDVRAPHVTARMAISDANDVIQRHLVRGRFYEEEELERVASLLPRNAIVLDIGANIGNHTLYLATIPGVQRIYPVEPNPEALMLLEANIQANECFNVDTRFCGFAFSNEPRRLTLRTPPGNLGATRGIVTDCGEAQAIVGDLILETLRISPDHVKIDVEGSEIDVLLGLQKTIRASQPSLLLEVDDRNRTQVLQLLEDWHYQVTWRNRRYRSNENWIALPT
jgi:FkbM family methyltransferase